MAQDNQVTFYYSKICPYAQRSWMALLEKKIPAEFTEIDLGNKPAWFLDINPLGKVPALKLDDKIVYESLVIQEFLEDIYPDKAPLVPKDPYLRAVGKMIISRADPCQAAFGKWIANKDPTKDSEFRAAFDKEMRILEDLFLKDADGPFFLGEFSLADIAFAPFIGRWQVLLPPWRDYSLIGHSDFPRLSRWVEALFQRPSYQSTISPPEELLAMMAQRFPVVYMIKDGQVQVREAVPA